MEYLYLRVACIMKFRIFQGRFNFWFTNVFMGKQELAIEIMNIHNVIIKQK